MSKVSVRNYTPPKYVMRAVFANDGLATGVTSMVHISGAHANLVQDDDTLAGGLLGSYSNTAGLIAELPRILNGTVLDRDSVKVLVKNPLLRYFTTTTENFIIPANSKNEISADASMQAAGFSFATNGLYPRSDVFGDRDVKVGDVLKVTADFDGTSQEIWTKVASLRGKTEPSEVGEATPSPANAGTSDGSATITGTSDSASTLTATCITNGQSWSDPMLAAGHATDTYLVECIIAGTDSSARFKVTSVKGDSNSAVTPVIATDSVTIKIGSLDADLSISGEDIAFTVGMSWTISVQAIHTPAEVTASGVYDAATTNGAPNEVVYTVKVTKGGLVPATPPTTDADKAKCPTVTVTTDNGSDKTPTVRILSVDTPYTLSRYGILLTVDAGTGDTYLIAGDEYFITVESPYYSTKPTLVMARNIPDIWVSDTDTQVSIELFINNETANIPEYSVTDAGQYENWELNAESITLNPSIYLYDSSYTVNGALVALPLYGNAELGYSTSYMTMRYFVSDLSDTITRINSVSELNALVSGPTTLDNPLKYAAYYALNNGTGSAVLITSVADPSSLDSWANVLDLISERDDIFHLLPITLGDTRVDQLFYDHTLEMNVPEVAKERMLHLISYDTDIIPILQEINGQPVKGKFSVETSVGTTQYAAFSVEDAAIDFTALGVRIGDTLRANYDLDRDGNTIYSSYTVEEVINATELRLTIDPALITPSITPVVFELWRSQNNLEFAETIAATGGFQDKLVQYIYTDNVDPSWDQVKCAAALVGLIGSVVPHQGVTWYPLTGFTGDGWTGRFSNSQLDIMGGNGVTIITRDTYGRVSARHSVTTDKYPAVGTAMTNYDTMVNEEVIVRNVLLTLKQFRQSIDGFIGVTNIVESTIEQLRYNLMSTGEILMNSADYPLLGGRITSGPEDIIIRQHAILLDRLVISFTCFFPAPLNGIDCTITCQLANLNL